MGAAGYDEINDIINQGIEAGLSVDDITRQLEAMTTGKKEKSVFFKKSGELKGGLGVSSLGELVQQQIEFNKAYDPKQIAQLQQITQAGRQGAMESIAGIQKDFVAPSRQDILNEALAMENIYRAQIARERADSEKALLEQANTMGINPGARLGRLDEWQAMANLDAGPQGLQRALQLLSGQQGVQSNALNALQASLANQNAAASNQLSLQNSLGQQAFNQSMQLYNAAANQASTTASNIANTLGNAGAGLMAYSLNREASPGVSPYGGSGDLGSLLDQGWAELSDYNPQFDYGKKFGV
jgi:hypothetical protein